MHIFACQSATKHFAHAERGTCELAGFLMLTLVLVDFDTFSKNILQVSGKGRTWLYLLGCTLFLESKSTFDYVNRGKI